MAPATASTGVARDVVAPTRATRSGKGGTECARGMGRCDVMPVNARCAGDGSVRRLVDQRAMLQDRGAPFEHAAREIGRRIIQIVA
eukprot:scaffold28784_cov112-Isochrysis_galbana.AAC.5